MHSPFALEKTLDKAVFLFRVIFSSASITSALAYLLVLGFFFYEKHLHLQLGGSPPLPSGEEFLQHGLKDVVGLIDEKCPICKQKFEAPVKTPCNHNFCRKCLVPWLAHKSSTCPNCQRLLFSHSLKTEIQKKRCAAAVLVGCPLTILSLFYEEKTTFTLALNFFIALVLAGTSGFILFLRIVHGLDWWKRFLIFGEASENNNFEDVSWITRIPEGWLLYQAIRAGGWGLDDESFEAKYGV